MAKNITYLLGAGASAHCLSVITEMVSHLYYMTVVLVDLMGTDGRSTTRIDTQLHGATNQLIADLRWLISEMEKHQTVDTLAKKFYLIPDKHEELSRLKKVLTMYFLFEQSFNEKGRKIRGEEFRELPDKRYDSFIAAIIGNKVGKYELPSNLKFITWNYDLQFELSYKEYQNNKKQSFLTIVGR